MSMRGPFIGAVFVCAVRLRARLEMHATPGDPALVQRLTPMLSIIAAFSLSGCGAEDRLAPYTPPPPNCPEADDYLAPLYQLEAEGRLTNLAYAVRTRIPDDARRDLLDALLRLLGVFEDGDFSALADTADAPDEVDGPGLQVTLGKILGWVAETGPRAPNLPLTQMLRRALATCEGAPVFALLSELVADGPLVTSLIDTLTSDALRDGLGDLDFEGANGREALSYLVRNLLISASSEAFAPASLIDLLGLLVDVDMPPYADLTQGLVRLLDADGLPRLQGLLVCLNRVDPDLVLGGFLYDFLTSGLLAESLPADAPELSEGLREVAVKALDALASDAQIRRGLSPALLTFLADDVAPIVLGDIADLLSAQALSGVFDLVIDLASGACRQPQ